MVNGNTNPTSNPESITITAHSTALTLSFSASANPLPWGAPISVSGTLTDTTNSTNILSSQPITFTGSGVGTITGANTGSGGTFTASGNAPSSVSSFTINAQFASSHGYMASNIPSVTYSTIKHPTSLTLNPISSVTSGAELIAAGILTDTVASNAGVPEETITYGGTAGSIFNAAITVTNTGIGAGTFISDISSANLPPTNGLQLQAIFVGDSLYGPSNSVTQLFSIFQAGGTPSITITSPTNNAILNTLTFTVKGTASDSTSGVASVQVKVDGGSYVQATGTTNWSIPVTVTTGSHTIIALVTNNAGNTFTTSVSVTVDPISQIDGYVVFGTQQVHIEQNDITTAGNVGLQNSGQIHIEQNSKLNSSAIVGDTIHLEHNSVVDNMYFNKLNSQGTILGTQTAPLTLPVLTYLPYFPTFNDYSHSPNINVNSGTQKISSGKYNNISAGNGVTLEFTGGSYNMTSLSFGDNVILKFDEPSILIIQSSVNGGQHTILNPTLRADMVLFYAGSQIHIGQSSTISANMYAPNDQIHLEQNSVDTGAFIAQSVHIEQGSTINFDYGFPVINGPGSNYCDLDYYIHHYYDHGYNYQPNNDQGHNDQGHNDQGHNDQGHNDQGHNDQGHNDQGHNDQGHNGHGHS